MQAPDGWKKSLLGEVVTFSQGIQVDVDQQNEHSFDDSVRFLRISDFVNRNEPPRYINNPGERFIVNPTDLSMIRYGSAGAGDVVKGLSGAIANNLFRIIPNESLLSKEYTYIYLRQPKIKHYLFSNTTSSTMPAVSFKLVETVPILIPPDREQQKIAQILSTWDKAIEKLEALIAAKQKRKKALMQQLLTGKKRFAGFEGDWKTQPLAKICKIVKGEQLNRDTLSEIGSFPVINGGITPSGYGEVFNRESNMITISEGGNSCGFVNLIRTRFWCGGHCYALESVKPNNEYLYQALKLNEHKIMRLRVGSGLPNIQKKDIEHFHLDIPSSKEEQQKIATVLTTADTEIQTHQNQLSALKEQKKGLMQQLLTGKKRVTL